MKKDSSTKLRVFDFFKGRGMLVGLLVFFIAVGVGSYAVYKSTINKLTDSKILTSAQSSVLANKQEESVEKTTASTAAVSEAESSEEEASSIDTETQPLVMPLEGEVINPFSNGELVKSETLGYWETHDGVDIKGELGDKVVAMTSGTVTQVYEDPLFGTSVIIDHGNNIEGHYYNLAKSVDVSEGDSVNSGQKIGEVGDTADSESKLEPHLHFGLKENNKWIDPISFISPDEGK